MSLVFETKSYRLTGKTSILGSQPGDPQVRTNFLASKAPTQEQGNMETSILPENDKGCTVFLRDPENGGGLCLMDYTLVGFFKGAAKANMAVNGIKSVGSNVGTYVFTAPRVIPNLRNGQIVKAPDRILERSLRAETMQGPHTSLAASEVINVPWTIEFQVTLLLNEGTSRSKAVTWGALEDVLDYGALKGLGQWRNGGYGRFIWEEMKK